MKKISVKKIAFVGVMAAMIYVSTLYIKVEIPSPAGGTVMLKAANALCLLAGILFGGVYGGLAAGIGSSISDLMSATHVASAPYTFCQFFLMAAVCGWIAHARGKEGGDARLNTAAVIAGSLSNFFFYIGRKVITLLLAGSTFGAALAAVSTNVIVSFVNAVVGAVLAGLLALPLRKALIKAHIL
ncbi:MAG: ECF transporter S component [Eubacteriales bacterium]|nr:ECF transporter S component [Eubacteriales bacterium]